MAALTRHGGSGIGTLINGLLRGTSLSKAESPFESFGPLAAARAASPAAGEGYLAAFGRQALFRAEEARRRMSSFLEGGQRPAGSFVEFLASNLLGLEKRSYGGGKPTTHLVDKLTGQSVAAAEVDPRKLSERRIQRMVAGSPASDRRMQVAAEVASSYRSKLAPFLRNALETGKPPFVGWEDVGFTLPAALKGRAYAVRDGEAYIGTKVATCANDPEETKAALRRMSAEMSAKFGRKVQFVFDRAMTPGTPILIADRNLVKARSVDASLSADRLANAFGKGLNAHYADLLGASAHAASGASVVSLDEFRRRFVRKPEQAPAPAPQATGSAFGFEDATLRTGRRPVDDRTCVVQYVGGGAQVWDIKNQREVPMTDLHLLPKGVYLKEDEFGMPFGRLRVGEDSSLTHLDMDGREHNLDGASFEPAPNSPEPRRWAVGGETFDTFGSFKARREEVYAQAADHAAVPEEPSAGRTYGR